MFRRLRVVAILGFAACGESHDAAMGGLASADDRPRDPDVSLSRSLVDETNIIEAGALSPMIGGDTAVASDAPDVDGTRWATELSPDGPDRPDEDTAFSADLTPFADPLWPSDGALFAGGGWTVGWRPTGRGTGALTVLRDGVRWKEVANWPPIQRERDRKDEDRCIPDKLESARIEGRMIRLSMAASNGNPSKHKRLRWTAHAPCASETYTVDLDADSGTQLVAGPALTAVEPLSGHGFPAIAPDTMHIIVLDSPGAGSNEDLRLRVIRTDDGRIILDETLLSARELETRRNEDAREHAQRIAGLVAKRTTPSSRLIERVGFEPMARATPPQGEVLLRLPPCRRRGPTPCHEDGCEANARVVQAWQGGDEEAGLGVELLRVVPLGAQCGTLPIWQVRRLEP